MASGAEINFLGDGGALADFDFAQRIGIGTVTETGTVAQSEIPWDRNPRARMDEGRALYLRLKHAQPKKPPRIEWLRSPLTKNEPAEFPKRAQSPLPVAPRGFERAGLIRINDLFVRHLK